MIIELARVKPTVGILFDKRGDPPYVSVGKLWKETINIISDEFQTEVLEVDTYTVKSDSKYQEFIEKIDVLMMLSPYYSIDRSLKNFPVVAYGLGSMQKGGHWLVDNKNSFKSCDSIILNSTVCQSIFDELVKNNCIEKYVIPFGVDTSIFYPRFNKTKLRKKYNVPENAFIMLYCGRINLQKNPLLLLSLLKNLEKKYENLYLMMIGSYDDFYISEFSNKEAPNVKKEFQNLIDKFHLGSKVIVFENQIDSNIYAEMINMADIGINLTTLISENFGYTPVEMQACGLPVIGTDWGGLKDTIIDGVTGFHIQTLQSKYGARINMEQVKNRIEILINDYNKLKNMGIKAAENVKEGYSCMIFAKNVQNIIQETYDRFVANSKSEYEIVLNPIMERMSNHIHQKYGETRHVSWEHLHPEIDFEHYDLIASKCSTYKAKDMVWTQNSIISKGFDWVITEGNFVSYDPRWNTEFELVKWELNDKEIYFLDLIDKGYSINELIADNDFQWEQTFKLLSELTEKGLLFPWEESEREIIKDDK